MVSCKGIIEPLRFEHIKSLLLVLLEDVKWDIFLLCPAFKLRLIGDYVSTLYSKLCGNLRVRDDSELS